LDADELEEDELFNMISRNTSLTIEERKHLIIAAKKTFRSYRKTHPSAKMIKRNH